MGCRVATRRDLGTVGIVTRAEHGPRASNRRRWIRVLVVLAAAGLACGSFLVLRSPPSDARVPAVVLFVGDSHLRGALPEVQAELVDREAGVAAVTNAFGGVGVKDSPYLAARIAGARQATGGLDAVVVGLGTNDVIPDHLTTDVAGRIDDLVDAAGGAPVLWLTLATTMRDRPGAGTFNAALVAAVDRHPNLTLVDFGPEWDVHPEWFAVDGLHLGPEGRAAYADAVAHAVDERLADDDGDDDGGSDT